jgi:hypothetical protein
MAENKLPSSIPLHALGTIPKLTWWEYIAEAIHIKYPDSVLIHSTIDDNYADLLFCDPKNDLFITLKWSQNDRYNRKKFESRPCTVATLKCLKEKIMNQGYILGMWGLMTPQPLQKLIKTEVKFEETKEGIKPIIPPRVTIAMETAKLLGRKVPEIIIPTELPKPVVATIEPTPSPSFSTQRRCQMPNCGSLCDIITKDDLAIVQLYCRMHAITLTPPINGYQLIGFAYRKHGAV